MLHLAFIAKIHAGPSIRQLRKWRRHSGMAGGSGRRGGLGTGPDGWLREAANEFNTINLATDLPMTNNNAT